MEEFISESPFKTCPMKIIVTDEHSNIVKSYDVPAFN